MSSSKTKTWKEKLNIDRKPEVEVAKKPFAGINIGERLLIPTPKLIDTYIRQIPKGQSVSVETLKSDLAAEFHADKVCPLTTGIFLRIVSEAAYEDFINGKHIKGITPFWRIVDENSKTAKKLSFGTEFLIEQRRREGISNVTFKKEIKYF